MLSLLTKVLSSKRGTQERERDLKTLAAVFEGGGRGCSQGCGQLLEAGKGKDFCPGASRKPFGSVGNWRPARRDPTPNAQNVRQ